MNDFRSGLPPTEAELAEITTHNLIHPLSRDEWRSLMRKVLDFIAENDGIFGGEFTEYDILRIIEAFEKVS